MDALKQKKYIFALAGVIAVAPLIFYGISGNVKEMGYGEGYSFGLFIMAPNLILGFPWSNISLWLDGELTALLPKALLYTGVALNAALISYFKPRAIVIFIISSTLLITLFYAAK